MPAPTDGDQESNGELAPTSPDTEEYVGEVTPASPSQIKARRASFSADQLVVSTGPLPSITEMEWMKENCPEFLSAFHGDILDESNHRRGIENKMVNTARYIATLGFATVAFVAWQGNAWAAATLTAAAGLIYASSVYLISSKSKGDISNLTLENRGIKEEVEESHVD